MPFSSTIISWLHLDHSFILAICQDELSIAVLCMSSRNMEYIFFVLVKNNVVEFKCHLECLFNLTFFIYKGCSKIDIEAKFILIKIAETLF